MADPTRRFPDWLPHVLPYALFLVLTELAAHLPGSVALFAYPVRMVAVAGVLFFFWRRGRYPELGLSVSFAAIAVGVVGYLLWVLPESALSFLPKIGHSTYDPRAAGPGWFRPLAIGRLVEATLVVPLFEELFLRSFLIRYLDMIREDRDTWRDIPIGRYRRFSFLGVVLAMAVTHHRWLRAGLWSALVTGLLYREKKLGPVIWAHAVTNLLLGIHVLATGSWAFW